MGRAGQVLSHWYTLFPDFQTSALDYYQAVEAELARREVPGIHLERIEWQESGVLTAKREYLRVARGRHSFDICAAPFGNGYFFSWWLAEQLPKQATLYAAVGIGATFLLVYVMVSALDLLGGLLLTPVALAAGLWFVASTATAENLLLEDIVICTPGIRDLYRRFFKPFTYYSLDTALMFQEVVRKAVLTVIGDLRSGQGLRALSPEESQPKLRLLKGLE
jgi:hypothetical protein